MLPVLVTKSEIIWKTIESGTGAGGMIHDWEGLCIQKAVFEPKKGLETETAEVVEWSCRASDRGRQRKKDYGPVCLFSLCPMEDAFKASFFTTRYERMRTLIKHSVVWTVKERRTSPVSANLERAVFCAASESEKLSKIFRSSCNQALSCNKNGERLVL